MFGPARAAIPSSTHPDIMRPWIRNVAILALALLLVGVFLRNANLAQVWSVMRQARLELVALGVLCLFATYVFRTLRWQVMLAPLGPTHFGIAFRATVIGFAASFVLPARAGEILRPWLLARREGLGVAAVLATIVLERVLDLAAVLGLLAVFLLAFDPGLSTMDPAMFRAVRAGGLAAAGAAAGGMAVMFACASRPELLVRLAQWATQWLPEGPRGAVGGLARTFSTGLASVREPRRLAAALAWSLPLWLTIAAQIWVVSIALGVILPVSGSLLVTALLVVGVAVPTPGGGRRISRGLPPGRDDILRRGQRPRDRRGHRPARRGVPADPRRRRMDDGAGRIVARAARSSGRRRQSGGDAAVKCPYCGLLGDKVVDSRESKEGDVIRRRRQCLNAECAKRFTSYERIDEIPYMVVKKDGTRERFERQKLVAGLLKACEKRPVSVAAIESVADRVEGMLQDRAEKEIGTTEIGAFVMQELRQLDKVAYVRFASVYRQFRDIGEFMTELKDLLSVKE